MKENAYAVPEEHKDFFGEYFALLKKYPKVSERYALADRGTHSLAHLIFYECEEFEFGDGSPGLDCRPVIKE